MSTNEPHPHRTLGKRLLAFLLWGLLAAVFGLTGWFFMLKPVATAAGNWTLARDYQPTQATPIKQTGKDDAGSFDWYSARYEAGGKTYETNRLSLLEDEAIDESFNATVLKRLERAAATQQPVEIYVSPRKPEIAVISRDFPLASLWPKLLVGAGFALFALAGVAGMLGSLVNLRFYRAHLEAAPLWGFAAAWCGFIFPIFLLVLSGDDIEWFAVIMVGLFVLVGIGVLWGAIAISFGAKPGPGVQVAGRRHPKLDPSALATSYGKDKQKAVKGAVKRGGLGGRTGDFDRN